MAQRRQISPAQRGEFFQQGFECFALTLFKLREAVEGFEGAGLAVFEQELCARYPVGPLSIDQMSDHIVWNPRFQAPRCFPPSFEADRSASLSRPPASETARLSPPQDRISYLAQCSCKYRDIGLHRVSGLDAERLYSTYLIIVSPEHVNIDPDFTDSITPDILQLFEDCLP